MKFKKIYNRISDKVSDNIKNGFDSEPVYNEKYLKTKINSQKQNISTNFHGEKVQDEVSQSIGLLLILIDSIFRTSKNIILKFFQKNQNIL